MSQGSVLCGLHKVTHHWGWERWSFRLSLDIQVIRELTSYLGDQRRLLKGMVFYSGLGRWVRCGSTETRGRASRWTETAKVREQ